MSLLNAFTSKLLKRQWIPNSSLEMFWVKFHSFLQCSAPVHKKAFGKNSQQMFFPLSNALNSFFTHHILLCSVDYLGPRILSLKCSRKDCFGLFECLVIFCLHPPKTDRIFQKHSLLSFFPALKSKIQMRIP